MKLLIKKDRVNVIQENPVSKFFQFILDNENSESTAFKSGTNSIYRAI